MIVSFDGNVYTGKTTLIKLLSERYCYTIIDEHSSFIDRIRQENHYGNEYLDVQRGYLEVDVYRRNLLKDNVNLLDRSFVSVSAHVYAIFKIGLVDIRDKYLKLLESKFEEMLMPDVFVFVSCKYNSSYSRCVEASNKKHTEDIYLSRQYLKAVNEFNANWVSIIGGCSVDTEDIPTEAWLSNVHNQIFSDINFIPKKVNITIDSVRHCLGL